MLQENDLPGRILVVDDDPAIRDVLAQYLRSEGFDVVEAADGVAALERAQTDRPDLIILDLTLPRISGLEVFRRLRATGETPVIILTARVDEVARVVGLELGADDYVGKPFSPREVVARVKTVLRRSRRSTGPETTHEPSQRIAALEIDRNGHEVRRDGKSVALTPTEFRILDVLASNLGRVFSRDQLLDKVSKDQSDVFDRTLDRHIANLRHKIEPDPTRPRYILTVVGIGYKMAPQ
jgi:DNA-binding response OmpR family regulator